MRTLQTAPIRRVFNLLHLIFPMNTRPSPAPCILAALVLCLAVPVRAQTSDPKALETLRAAIAAQLEADRVDHSNWTYLDHDGNATYRCVGSPQGELRRKIQIDGHPVSQAVADEETTRLDTYVHSPAEQAKAHKNAVHDDVQATELLKMLPDAFLWTTVSDKGDLITLSYRPNPNFDGPDMQSRVMSTMAGEMVIARNGNHYRIRTFRGALVADFKIAFGLVGRLYKGGTFDVERREVAPGYWEITETHVHIGGHVLLFHSIGTQQDEVKTDWKPSPAQSLSQAETILSDAH